MIKKIRSRVLQWVGVLGIGLLSLTACTLKHSGSTTQESGQNHSVNLAIWSNYISPELISAFQKKTGIKIQVSNFSSNEELLAKLQTGASGYDIAVPSDYMVYAMTKLGLLQELDYSRLSNAKLLDPRYLKKPYDPENKYSVPYDWGTTGIAINRSLYHGKIRGWKDLFSQDDLIGKFSLLDDVREVLGAALKSEGYSLNSTQADELKKAKGVLLKVQKRVKAFTSEPLMPLVNGEVAAAHAYMSDALQARKATGGKIDYIIPEEGGTLWVDNLVIPKGAKHLHEAYLLMNFLLEASSNVSTVMSVYVSPANKGVFELLPKDFQTNTVLFPPDSALAKCEMIRDLGDTLSVWDRIWTEVKADN